MSGFKVMLAASEIPAPEQIQFPVMASYKLDGIRSPIISGKAMSRKMIPIPNAHFQLWVDENSEMLEGIDCEVISGAPCGDGVFNRTTSAIMKVSGAPHFKIYVFDAFGAGVNMPAHMRYVALKNWYASLESDVKDRVILIEQRMMQSIAELEAYMEEAMGLGYEGLILKHPQKIYKNGRSTINEGTLLKWKQFADAEAVIIEVKEGTTNTNPKEKDALGHSKRSTAKAGKIPNSTCGGFVVQSDLFGTFSVSPGHQTMAELQLIFDNADKYVGKIMVFTYQPYGVLKLPRFPQFKGLRDPMDT